MNKAYKVVRNGNGQMVVTSELGKTRRKLKLATMLLLMINAPMALALAPSGDFSDCQTGTSGRSGVVGCNGIQVSNFMNNQDKDGAAWIQRVGLSADVQAKLDKINELERQIQTGNNNVNNLADGAVMYDDPQSKDKVTLNKDGAATLITNLQEGAVQTGSKDAVNGNQLFDVKTTAEKAVADAAAAQSTANTANTKADAAKAAAATADAKAVTADGKATAAQTTANKAVTDAAAAQTTANTANTKADAAKVAAATADAKAVTADGKATAAQTTANKAVADAATAQSTANTANTKADAAKAAAATADAKAVTADGKATAAQTTANKAVSDAATAQSTANTANTKADAAKAAAATADAKAVAADAKAVTADGKATAAQTTANKAVTDAATAQSTANTATTKADAAKAAAATADAKAVTADGKATAAQTTANKAVTDAAAAQSTANTANTKADAAKAAAATADAKAVTADGKATAAQTTANKAVTDAAAAQSTANTANTKADKNTADIATLQEADKYNVKYDSLAKDKVTLGGTNGTTVAGVKAGTLAANSTEAVNGAQLFDTNQKVADNSRRITVNEGNITKLGNRTTVIEGKLTDLDGKTDQLGTSVAANLGGGSAYDQATGTVSAPSYTVAGGQHNNVGSAFAAVDGKLTQHGNQITNLDRRVTVNEGDIQSIIKGEKGLVQTDGQTTTIDKAGTATTVAMAGANGNRTVNGVKAGTLAADSTEAVNGAQLFDTNQKVADNSRRITVNEGNITKLGNRTTVIEGKLTDLDGKTDQLGTSVAANLGGGSAYDQVTGTVSAPSYTVGGSKHNNVGSAFAAVDGKLTQHGNQITNLDRRVTVNEGDIQSIIKGEKGLVQTDGQTTTIDKAGTSTVINVAGAGGDRVITGVANGSAPNDAINKGQFDTAIDKLVVDNNGRFDQLSERIDANRKSASQGIAAAMAMDIEYPEQHPGEWAAGVGMGTYDGQTSLGLGVNYLSRSGKFKVFGGFGQALTSGSRPAAKAGIGFVF